MIRWLLDKFARRRVMEMTFGELLDKRSIFAVKADRGIAPDQHWEQIKRIDAWLMPYVRRNFDPDTRARIVVLMGLLFDCNNTQFDFEDQVFELGGEEGLQAAKNSRKYNQRRAALKKEIDEIFGEKYLEVKKYAKLNN